MQRDQQKPKKSSALLTWASRILMVFLSAVILFCALEIYQYFADRRQSIHEFDDLLNQVTQGGNAPSGESDGMNAEDIITDGRNDKEDEEDKETEAESFPVVYRDIVPLYEQNEDFFGWIYIAGTKVNYPVMHTPANPQKYLHLSFNGEESAPGVPFMDYRCRLDSDNIILYGHHMKNGTMFANIVYYNSKEFWAGHKTIEFETRDECGIYTVFAAMLVKPNDTWYSFVNAASEADFNAKISAILRRSYIDTDIVPQYGQQIITMSTCYGDDRFIVLAVRTDTKEFRTQAEADAAAAAGQS